MKKLILSKLFIFLLATPLFAADEGTANNTTNEQASSEQSDSNNTDKNPDEKASQERVLPDPHKQQQTDIANMLKGSMTEIIELKAQEESFNLYVLAADEKEPLGNVLFFPDPRTHSDWPITLSPLRVGLSHYKWQTAVMTMPVAQLPKIPDRSIPATDEDNAQEDNTDAESTQTDSSDNAENNEPTANTDSDTNSDDGMTSSIPNNELIMARAQASITTLNETSDVIILIGIGQGATWATEFATSLSEAEKEKVRLILINAKQSLDTSAKDLNQMISELKIDTYDIYSAQNKNSSGINHALARKRAANKSDIENYKQIKAPQSAWRKQGNEWLYRKVLGVIKTNIAAQLEALALEEMKPQPAEKTNQKPGA